MDISTPLLSWYDRNRRSLPWRGTRDPYRIWLSEVMLQQTRAQTVCGYYARFLQAFPDVFALARADEAAVLKLWEGLGYYTRARNLHAAAKQLAEAGGHFPDTSQGLRALPGIGPYAANAIASIAYNEPVPALDGNQARVLSRLLAWDKPLRTPFDLEPQAQALLSRERPGDWNQALMDLSSLVCTPRSPTCADCPLSGSCTAHADGDEVRYPVRIKAAAKKEEDVLVILAEDPSGRIALRRRPSKGMLGGLYEFCTLSGSTEAEALRGLDEAGFTPAGPLVPLPPSKHVFTHRIWRMKGFIAPVAAFPSGWLTAETLEPYAFPTAFRAYTQIARGRLARIDDHTSQEG